MNHLFAPAVKNSTPAAQKTGAITGSVVDTEGHPIAGAKVWGGFPGRPFSQDITDQSGQFALDKIAAPECVTVTADGYAADQQGFDPTNVPGPLLFRLSPVPPLKCAWWTNPATDWQAPACFFTNGGEGPEPSPSIFQDRRTRMGVWNGFLLPKASWRCNSPRPATAVRARTGLRRTVSCTLLCCIRLRP